MKFLKKIPFHPIIFAPYPVLALAANNISWVHKLDFYWALGITVLAMLLILLILWLLSKNIHTAAAITSLFIFLFFTYGHVYNLVAKGHNPTVWLTTLWILLLVGGARWIRSQQDVIGKFTLILNQICMLLLLFPLITLGVDHLRDQAGQSPSEQEFIIPTGGESLSVDPSSPLPDIYYIILDGYARADTLADVYDYDNQPTLDYLKQRGFYIAEEGYANYHHTALSLSTTLNMTYIKELLTEEGIQSYRYRRIIDHIHENVVFELTSQLGYQLAVFDAGYTVTEIFNADHYIRPEVDTSTPTSQYQSVKKPDHLGLFETRYLETSALRPLLPIIGKYLSEDSRYEDHRQHVLSTFSHLPMFAEEEGAYFVFAYILAPHPPFVFDADGDPVSNWRLYTVSDGSHWVGDIGTRSEYIQGYRDQIQYVNTLLVEAIDEILDKSETPPIIIIQADHGPGAYFEWDSIKLTNLQERMGILNAIYIPDGHYEWLYPSISSINTFRGIFSHYFGADFELIEDRAYISKWGRPFEFEDITDQIQAPNSR
jgi:hypothetical protein